MSTVVIRPARRRDREPVGRFLTGLSPVSRNQRFFTEILRVSPELVRSMVAVSPGHHVLLALDGDAVVGHVMAVRIADHTVDVGIVVADAYRQRGIGRRLIRELTAAVTSVGVTTVQCDVLCGNYFVLRWLRRLLPVMRVERAGATLIVTGEFKAGGRRV